MHLDKTQCNVYYVNVEGDEFGISRPINFVWYCQQSYTKVKAADANKWTVKALDLQITQIIYNLQQVYCTMRTMLSTNSYLH